MATVALTEYEVELVRFCAQHYLDKSEILGFVEFPRYGELGRDKILKTVERFQRFGLMQGWASNGIEILPAVFAMLEEWDNPPLPDYRDQMTKWFWSKPWSLVAYVLVVGLPAVVGWISMLKTVVGWIGVKQ